MLWVVSFKTALVNKLLAWETFHCRDRLSMPMVSMPSQLHDNEEAIAVKLRGAYGPGRMMADLSCVDLATRDCEMAHSFGMTSMYSMANETYDDDIFYNREIAYTEADSHAALRILMSRNRGEPEVTTDRPRSWRDQAVILDIAKLTDEFVLPGSTAPVTDVHAADIGEGSCCTSTAVYTTQPNDWREGRRTYTRRRVYDVTTIIAQDFY